MMDRIWVVDDEDVVYTTLWEVTFIDEKNKRHRSSLVPITGTSEE